MRSPNPPCTAICRSVSSPTPRVPLQLPAHPAHTPSEQPGGPAVPPAAPSCAPGQPAIAPAENPEPGDWLYFVTVNMQGGTLFTRDYQQHLANIELAKHNGVLDSAR